MYECLAPTHLNYGQPGRESATRITLVAIKGSPVDLVTSPAAASVNEDMPEEGEAGLLSRVLRRIGSDRR